MKNLLKKFGIQRLIVAAITAISCVGMLGCGDWFPEDGEREFFDSYGIPKVVGFIDDSLVIVADERDWQQKFADGTDVVGGGHQRLRVFNYRIQEIGPRWTDTLDNYTDECNYIKGQLSDSIIWGGNGKKTFSFWKIGEKPRSVSVETKFEDCSVAFNYYGIQKMRPWMYEKIYVQGNTLTAGNDTCQYAVLNTIAKTLTYKRLDDNLKWIQRCDDVRAWGDDVYCLYYDALSPTVYIKKENRIVDSILVEKQDWYSGSFFMGDVMLVDGNVCEYKTEWMCYPRQGILKIDFYAENGRILQF